MRRAGFIPVNSHVEVSDPPFVPGSFPYEPVDPGRGYCITGMDRKGAVQTEFPDFVKGGARFEPEPVYDPPTDAEWLATLPLYKQLAGRPRKLFVAEALAFRAVTPFRLAFVEATRAITDASKKAGGSVNGPWLSRHYRYLRLNDPSRWTACRECHGSGDADMFGPCPECKGNGYTV